MVKTIYVWGGWSRNYGDLAIWQGQTRLLQEAFSDKGGAINFVPINSDLSLDGSTAPVLTPNLIDVINSTGDMLIVGGGGQVMPRTDKESVSGWQFNVSIKDLKKLNVPLVCYALGYNKTSKHDNFVKKTGQHLKCVFKQAELFSVRDFGSQQAIQHLAGVPIKNSNVIPDPATFCVPGKVKLPWKNYVIVSWTGDRVEQRFGGTGGVIKNIKGFCSAVQEGVKEDVKILYVPHVSAYDSFYFPVFKSFFGDRILNLQDVFLEMYPESFAYVPLLVALYKKARLVFGMRGHSCIIPYGQGTSLVALGPHTKNKFFADFAGVPFAESPSDAILCFEQMKLQKKSLKSQRKVIDKFNQKLLRLL